MKLSDFSLTVLTFLLMAGSHAQAQTALKTNDSPSLTTSERENELFSALDLSSDALKPVATDVAVGNYPAAEHELAEYFRHRTDPAWKFDAKKATMNPSGKDPVAEDAVKGRVQGGLVQAWHTFPDNKIDWHYNETLVTPGLAKNWEWQWQLCRMGFWNNLADAYRGTHDERYAQAWVPELLSFIAQCPPPAAEDESAGSAWRTIDSGIRMSHSWPNAFFSFLPSSQFTDQDVALYLDSTLEHARYMTKFHAQGNWLTLEMSGLYTIGAYFPEFKEAKAWRDDAGNTMYAQETAQFLPDGMQNELSTMYHYVALDSFVNIARIARNVGRINELPAGFVSGMEKAFDHNLYLMTPDRTVPEFNDSTSWTRSVVKACSDAFEFFPDRTDFQWVATDGKEGKPPAQTSYAFPWGGFYVMRSGWDTEANYLVFRAGPLGAGHAHQDKLNVVLWAYGRYLLFNSGGAAYERSQWRDYSVNTFSKNTVLVDGKPQVRDPKNRDLTISKQPIDARWESTPAYDFAAGTYDEGYGGLNARVATHVRRVLFVKPDLFIVADTLTPNDAAEHTYQARWNLLSTTTTLDAQTHAVTTTDANKPNLALVPLQSDNLDVRSASAQTTPELLGWYIRKDANPAHIPATTVIHTKKGTGVQNFLTLFVPITAGNASPIKSVEKNTSGAATVTFNDGHVFSITADPDPAKGIEVMETLPDGKEGRQVKVPAVAAH